MALYLVLVYFPNSKSHGLVRVRLGTKELSGISCLGLVAKPPGT